MPIRNKMAAFIRSMGCRLLASEVSATFITSKQNPCIDLKRYVRALRRRPVKVLYPEDEVEKRTETKQNNVRVVDQRSEPHQTYVAMKSGGKNKQKTEINEFVNSDVWRDPKRSVKATTDKISVDDELAGLRYEKAFPGDKRLARAVSVARSRKFREQQGKVLLEGKRLICDALAAGGIPQILFFSTVERLRELPLEQLRRASLVKVKFEDIKMWSDLVTPQGVMAIFARPDASRLVFPPEQRNQSVPLYLICDNVRDPGNVGTILRCAAAAGCQSVLLTKGCVDVWEPKVLRAAMGAHFRVPIIPNLDWEVIPKYLPTTVTVHLADNCSGTETDEDKESSGPPKKAGDYGWVSSRPNRKNMRYEEYGAEYESDSDEEEEEERPKLSLPAVESQLYHANWVQSHTALVIGGETHGLSLEALQLAERTDGRRLCVPMVTGVDSLNCAIAAGIILYEGKRQLTILAGQAGEKSRIKMP
ncbi:rRNA methyltransferase 3B, mitochondrial [Anguilla anguilla]|uniref:rRNA methyltransferase 3B, mitochondrial n=1 Tax=Anguilla anguilla TaxID=7936 RepID=UPI0015AD0112|nr:rRNA methyltransferase 3B, mitochondrial [Anguilla anguilla]